MKKNKLRKQRATGWDYSNNKLRMHGQAPVRAKWLEKEQWCPLQRRKQCFHFCGLPFC